MLKIIKGELYEDVTQAVKATGNNQCPCIVPWARNADTKCVCKEFRELQEEGHCHCRRYQKVSVDEL